MKSTTEKVMKATSSTSNEVIKMAKKGKDNFLKMCTGDNLLGCVVTILVILYVALLEKENSLDFFSTVLGKVVSMIVLLIALSIDVKLGVFVAVAIVLSVIYSSMNDLVESYGEEASETKPVFEEEETSQGDYAGVEPVESSEESSEEEEVMDSFEDYAPANF